MTDPDPRSPMNPALTMLSVERLNLCLAAAAVAAGWYWVSPRFAASLGFGALLEGVNFRGMHRQAQLLFWGEIRSGGSWTGLYGLRFGLLVIGIGGAIALGADALGLLLGLSLILPVTVIEAWRHRPAIDPNAPALADDDPDWDRWNPWLAREREADPEADDE